MQFPGVRGREKGKAAQKVENSVKNLSFRDIMYSKVTLTTILYYIVETC